MADQFQREAEHQFNAAVEQYRVARGPLDSKLWEATFEFAIDMGNTPKGAATYADAHAEAFAPDGPPKVDPKRAKATRERLVNELAAALRDKAQHAFAERTDGKMGTPLNAGPVAGVAEIRG